ncbi:hypothetical protein COMNV_01187 [Commensalibacter sp. Nvir]|uniref:NAD-dependent epimerase/dehydratase family protein n=1 Tax=Commensalibacter sp. Nvir TaxID=3069817 RepID=UPI002D34BAA0|nr:hypothetical protein COMNV_01187 [Commensalibacter sp. Nvir]
MENNNNPKISLPKSVHVIGANGRSGKDLVKKLQTYHCNVVALIRNKEKWLQTGIQCEYRLIDLDTKNPHLKRTLYDASHIVNTAHARYTSTILAAGPSDTTYIFLGSTRKFTKWPDSHGNGVLAGEKAFLHSKRNGVMLHPTMIYGSEGENNVQRLANFLKKLPIIPLPDGGKALVHPIHQSDVTKAILHALSKNWIGFHSIIIAGGSVHSYKNFIEIIMETTNIPSKSFINVPLPLLKIASLFTQIIPFVPSIKTAEIQRLIEDKNFSIKEMQEKLGFQPIDFKEGLKRTNF